MRGFSVRNFWNMKKWYSFYTLAGASADLIRAEMSFPSFFGFVLWRHHVEIVSRCNSVEEALFYLQRTIEEGWSRNALIDCIKADLYRNTGVANTNFAEKFPGIQGRIAQEIVKDTYDFSFILWIKDIGHRRHVDHLWVRIFSEEFPHNTERYD